MSAPNIATLYDWESHYEDALANYFANLNVGGFAFAQVLTPRTNINLAEEMITPRLQIKAATLGMLPAGSGISEQVVNGGRYYAAMQVQVTLDVCTARNNNLQPHGLLRGATREAMLEATAILNANTVPFYQTPFVNQMGATQAIDADNDEIQTQLTYGLDIFIPPSSYPNA